MGWCVSGGGERTLTHSEGHPGLQVGGEGYDRRGAGASAHSEGCPGCRSVHGRRWEGYDGWMIAGEVTVGCDRVRGEIHCPYWVVDELKGAAARG